MTAIPEPRVNYRVCRFIANCVLVALFCFLLWGTLVEIG